MNEKLDLDVTKYATSELRELASQIERRIHELQVAAIEDARAKVRAIANSVGVPLDEILRAVAPVRKGRVAQARYVNPDNTGQVWNGLGRKPRWLLAWLEQGRALADLRA